MVRWVVGSILHGGPNELFLVPASLSRLVHQKPWYVVSWLKDDAESVAHGAAAGFLSHYLSGPLPYVWRHITVNKMCWVRR